MWTPSYCELDYTQAFHSREIQLRDSPESRTHFGTGSENLILKMYWYRSSQKFLGMKNKSYPTYPFSANQTVKAVGYRDENENWHSIIFVIFLSRTRCFRTECLPPVVFLYRLNVFRRIWFQWNLFLWKMFL